VLADRRSVDGEPVTSPTFPQPSRPVSGEPGQVGGRDHRLATILFLAFAAGMLALLAAGGVTPVGRGELADPDAYMRLVRVSWLHETGAWYDDVLPRINAPYGETSHWTRPLDLLLLGPASLAAIATGPPVALYWTGVWISPVLLLLACLALAWAVRPLWADDRRLWLMAALFVQFPLLLYSGPGRADHHTLIALMSILVLGFGLRLARGPFDLRRAAATGLTAAAAIWVSPEGLFFLALVYLLLAIRWIAEGENGEARQAERLSVALAVGLACAMLLERPPAKFLVIEHDKISFVHFAAAGLTAGAWGIAARVGGRLATVGARLTLLGALALIAFALLAFVAPGFHRGILGAFDPRLESLWVPRIAELQPQIPINAATLATFLQFLGVPALVFPFVLARVWLGRREPDGHLHLGLAIAYAAFLVMGLLHLRLSLFAALLAPLYVADLAVRACRQLAASRFGVLRPAASLAIVAALYLGPQTAGLALASSRSAGGAGRPIGRSCPLSEIATWLEAQRPASAAPIILAQTDAFGPELLYRTGYRVVAGPYHRGHRGIFDLYDVWNAQVDEDARRIIERRGVDLLLLCRADDRTILYPGRDPDGTFMARVRAGHLPAWLTPVVLPTGLDGSFAVYRVRGRGATASSSAARKGAR